VSEKIAVTVVASAAVKKIFFKSKRISSLSSREANEAELNRGFLVKRTDQERRRPETRVAAAQRVTIRSRASQVLVYVPT
jgi:hypothetical protein